MRSANTKPLQFTVQSDDHANNGSYDSDYENEEFMENGNPPVDLMKDLMNHLRR